MPEEYHITTPISKDLIRKLNINDTVYLTGMIFGIRDATQRRIFNEKVKPPVDFRGYPCIHTAPNAKKVGEKWVKISIGTTTSTRMEKYTPDLITEYGVPAIIGKGGLLQGSLEAMKKYCAVYLAIVGGTAALETAQIVDIEAVFWEDLFPECIWQFLVRELGPLTVAMDSHGNNLYSNVRDEARKRLQSILGRARSLTQT